MTRVLFLLKLCKLNRTCRLKCHIYSMLTQHVLHSTLLYTILSWPCITSTVSYYKKYTCIYCSCTQTCTYIYMNPWQSIWSQGLTSAPAHQWAVSSLCSHPVPMWGAWASLPILPAALDALRPCLQVLCIRNGHAKLLCEGQGAVVVVLEV